MKPIETEKSAKEIAAEHAAWADSLPVTTRCMFCSWRITTTAENGRELAREHRQAMHPEVFARKRIKKRANLTRFKHPKMTREEAREVERERQRRARLHGVEVRDSGMRLDAGLS